jgi:hypothetical protein
MRDAIASAKLLWYARTLRLVDAVASGLYALHGAIWLGFMARAELNQVTGRDYSAGSNQASERDELYNRSGLNAWEDAALADYFAACGSVLVAGAGGGREVISLAREKLRVDGFECNPMLVDLAAKMLRDEPSCAAVLLSETDAVPSRLGVYDGAIVGFGVYSHIQGRTNRVRFLGEMSNHLTPGAPLLVSFAIRGESRRDRSAAAIARTIQRLRGIDSDIEIGDTLAEVFNHRFTQDEIIGELREGGFDLLSFRPYPFPHAIVGRR